MLLTIDSQQRREILSFFVTHCSAVEQKWLARIILKGKQGYFALIYIVDQVIIVFVELKVGISENSVFGIWHSEAHEGIRVNVVPHFITTQISTKYTTSIVVFGKSRKSW
jgi:hypothetical protein